MTGSVREPQVSMLRLLGIGYLLQWRCEGFWRELDDVQHRDEDEWAGRTGFAQPHARGGEGYGAAAWWMVDGELPGERAPEVVLTAGTRPPVHVLGRLWACEWHDVASSPAWRSH